MGAIAYGFSTPTKRAQSKYETQNMKATAAPTIHRFTFNSKAINKINMPAGAVILKMNVGSQGVNIFAMVDPTAEKLPRYFQAFQTGEELPAWAWDAVYHSVEGAPVHVLEVEAGHLKPQA